MASFFAKVSTIKFCFTKIFTLSIQEAFDILNYWLSTFTLFIQDFFTVPTFPEMTVIIAFVSTWKSFVTNLETKWTVSTTKLRRFEYFLSTSTYNRCVYNDVAGFAKSRMTRISAFMSITAELFSTKQITSVTLIIRISFFISSWTAFSQTKMVFAV